MIIPAVNCPCTQAEAVRAQLRDDDCLVVVWNGPRAGAHDCSANVLQNSAAVWLEWPTRMGAGAARNMGIDWLCGRAQVLAFVDSDDIAHDDWLPELREGLARDQLDLAGGVLEVFSGGHWHVVRPGLDFWYRQAVYGSNCAITREAWQRLNGFSTRVGTCEDTDLAWRAADIGLRVDIVPTAVVRYTLRLGAAEWRQRVTWGRSSVALLRAHDLPLSHHLPPLRGLISHKRSHGLASSPIIAGLGQFAGQSVGRVLDARPRQSGVVSVSMWD
ncbi:MAG: glycosyltransferase family 2 protein [Mycobacterium sp.]